ncbi:hypothetical protein BJ138DRAFT_1054822 [Hygrophoropsis aurantiaca]|uniref:Uncharacterized protein n=1 Tax=Hygrophoropsis aurantiaca TaxID=72124 RepID=A0ACB8ASX5_9AGAM|nr:hypothetical protein BJ138DRAFT_1054822 [Hygrophoropsis aurantiaca]
MPPSLKQKLAALSLAHSSPSSFSSAPNSPTSRRKIFGATWKRSPFDATGYEPDARDKVQSVMNKVIFQAGVDYETRPMVILNASALPDPKEVSYDLLLSRILSYLDLYVESDYTVVFFAAGGRHAPNWNWVWKAYRSLSRKYRKNLKRLYIVHSSFFSKMLFSLAGAIISPKFFRKLVYINTLSDLAHHVPLTQIDIPPAVYEENAKQESQIKMPIPLRSSVFGVPLDELMGYAGEKGSIPRVIKDSIQYLQNSGLEEDGLFRRSPNSVLLKQVQQAYDRGQVVSLSTFNDPHLAAVLLKKYLRDLPDPLFPENLYPAIRRCPTPTNDAGDMACVNYIRDILLPQLMPCAYILLSHVLHLMHQVSLRVAMNRMDAHNLAVVLCPNLVASPNPMKDVLICAVPGGPSLTNDASPSMSSSTTLAASSSATIPSSSLSSSTSSIEPKTTLGAVIKVCIQQYYEIFDEVHDPSEVVSRSLRRSASPPASSGSSLSGQIPPRPLSLDGDDEDIDDAMLVMPIGPSAGREAPPAGVRTVNLGGGGRSVPYQPRQRKGPAMIGGSGSGSGSGIRSINVDAANEVGGGYSYLSKSRARSTISMERANSGNGSGRGSISIGKGTMRKANGASVEAVGITAGGFFTPPGSTPPVPPLPFEDTRSRKTTGR